MIPCRETIWGSPQSGGIAALNPRLNLDFSLRENSCQRAVVSFQFLDFRCQRVAVGAPGRAPALRGCVRASFHSPLQRLVNQVILRSCRGVWKGTRMAREVMLPYRATISHQEAAWANLQMQRGRPSGRPYNYAVFLLDEADAPGSIPTLGQTP